MTNDQIQADYIARMGPDLGEFLYFLQDDVHWLHQKWREFTTLFGTNSGHTNLLNKVAANFFYYLFRLQFENALLHIARLTEPPENRHQANLSIKRLLLLVTDAALLQSLEARIAAAESSCGFARIYRNKWIAHTDVAQRLGAEPVLPAVEQSQVTDAIAAIQAVVRLVEEHYQIPLTATMDDPWGANQLVHFLKRHSP